MSSSVANHSSRDYVNVESVSASDVIDLNVGGVGYTTTRQTLTSHSQSHLSQLFSGDDVNRKSQLARDSRGRYVIDRDGALFRFVLDFLRSSRLALPENFLERERLRQEAEFYRLDDMVTALSQLSISKNASKSLNSNPNGTDVTSASATASSLTTTGARTPHCGYITLGYRGTFAFGRDGLADVKFRKLSRILICGRVSLCRSVFGETLNESRDPDRGGDDRYTSRFFLKHTFLEQAFDMLHEAGFRLVGNAASGAAMSSDIKPGMESEESKWNHYNEFVFCRA